MKDYVFIIVHKDVLADARKAILSLETDGFPYDDPRLRTLRDLTDPLPEEDVNGVTPMIIGADGDEPVSPDRVKALAFGLLGLKVVDVPEEHWVVLCGTNDRDGALPEVYGPFASIDEANEFLVPHRSTCDATDQAWLDDHDNADEAHDIEQMLVA